VYKIHGIKEIWVIAKQWVPCKQTTCKKATSKQTSEQTTTPQGTAQAEITGAARGAIMTVL